MKRNLNKNNGFLSKQVLKIMVVLSLGSMFGKCFVSRELLEKFSETKLTPGSKVDAQNIQLGSFFHSKPERCSPDLVKNILVPGYSLEPHQVITDDGYILTLFRMSKDSQKVDSSRPVVLVQHGLENDAATFLQNQEDGLVYLLVNAGFDVWLGNNRGNKFSRDHIRLKLDSAEFWRFSFDEMGKYDIPAFFKHIRKVTGQFKLSYIGHSQGTAQMFAALSDPETRPKVAPYLEVFYALAPVVFLNQNKVPVPNFATYVTGAIRRMKDLLGINYMDMGSCKWDKKMVDRINKECVKNYKKCYKSLKWYDLDPSVLNWANTGYLRMSSPSGESMNSVLHFAQLIEKQNSDPYYFGKYDYGSEKENLKIYGQKTAPLYDLSLIQERVRLWFGSGDAIVTQEEVERIYQALTNADVQIKELPQWGHSTFHLAINSKIYYTQLVKALQTRTY